MLNSNGRFKFLDLSLDNLSLEETIAKISAAINNRRVIQHIVLNALKVVQAHQSESLKCIINRCDIINPDGQSVVWASRLLGRPLKERIAGVDLMWRLFGEAQKNEWSVFLLGAEEKVSETAVKQLKSFFPKLKIAGRRNGYFSANEEATIVQQIRDAKPDILFVGISSPKKEFFLDKYLTALNVPFSMGVGGGFDLIAGKTKRAPLWIQNMGLEWFYRILQEPGRMWKRYAITNFLFLYLVLREKLRLLFS